MRWSFAVLGLVGCFHDAANRSVRRTDVEGVPEVRFAVATGHAVKIIRTSRSGLVIERTVPVPDRVSRILWVGPDPAVWLDMTIGINGEGFPPFGPDASTGTHQNEMGLLTTNGYVEFPAIEWPPATKPDGQFGDMMQEVTETNAALVQGEGALWERRCRWYGGPDGGGCAHEYARRYPQPVAFKVEVNEDHTVFAFPLVSAARQIRLGRSSRLRSPDEPEMPEWENKQDLLTCKAPGAALVTYPDEEQLSNNVRQEVIWLSTDPPMFRTLEGPVDGSGFGRVPPDVEQIWEGCKLSDRFAAATAGPDDITVLTGKMIVVLWRGREVGHLDEPGGHVAFAPR
jgi:hypothetical protein